MSKPTDIAFTGVHRKIFQFISLRVGASLKDSRNLTRELKLVLLFVKLKSNMTFINLASLFDVSPKNIRGTFQEILDKTYEALRHLIFWFNWHTVQSRMPPDFVALFPKTR